MPESLSFWYACRALRLKKTVEIIYLVTVVLKSILIKIKIGLIKIATEIQKIIHFFIKLPFDDSYYQMVYMGFKARL